MFNLYIYEKRLKNIEAQIKEKKESIIRRNLYLKNRDKLADNFHKKINNFLFEMIKKPIILNNMYYEPKEKKPTSPFCLFKFETDRERIGKLFQKTPEKKVKRYQSTVINYFRKVDNNNNNNNSNSNENNNNKEQYIDKGKKEESKNDPYNISNMKNFDEKNNVDETIIQPSMKFRPRNDLERIMDSITKNKGSIEIQKYTRYKNELCKHLLYRGQKEKEKKNSNAEQNYRKKDDKSNPNRNVLMAYDDQTKKRIKYINKKKINKKKEKELNKKNLSNTVKDLTEKYHSKTYFNSIEQALINSIQRHKKVNKEKKNDSKYRLKKNFSASSINFYSKITFRNHKNRQNQKSNLSAKSDYKKLEKFIDDKNNNNKNTLQASYDNIYKKEEDVEKIFELNDSGFVKTKSNKLDSKQKEALMILKDMSLQRKK